MYLKILTQNLSKYHMALKILIKYCKFSGIPFFYNLKLEHCLSLKAKAFS